MRPPIPILTFAALLFAVAPLVSAQSIRITDAAAIADGVSPPTVLESTFAPYTDDARSHAIEGTITIQVTVNEYGQIKDARILRGLGFGLDEAALNTVHDWLISPATRDGVSVSALVQIDVPFSLASANALTIRQEITPPSPLFKVQPVYPEEARRSGVEGVVVLDAVVKNDGSVDAVRVFQGVIGLTDSAIEAVKQFKFTPGQKDGRNVDVVAKVVINFRLPQGK